MRVRTARASDAARLAELLGQLGYPASAPAVSTRLADLLADRSCRVLVATAGGDVLAAATLHVLRLLEHDRPIGSLTAFVVDEGRRRRGVGSRLLAAVEQEAAARGCAGIVLGSAERRDDAHAFYAGHGYAFTGRRFAKALGAGEQA